MNIGSFVKGWGDKWNLIEIGFSRGISPKERWFLQTTGKMNFGWPILYGGPNLGGKETMKNWHKERKDLEEAIAIDGIVSAYRLIPKDMPVREFPQRLIDYHEEQFRKEILEEIPSPAKIARKARIDEFKRNRRKNEIISR